MALVTASLLVDCYEAHLIGARLGIPSEETVDTNAMGRGITDVVKILYTSLKQREIIEVGSKTGN